MVRIFYERAKAHNKLRLICMKFCRHPDDNIKKRKQTMFELCIIMLDYPLSDSIPVPNLTPVSCHGNCI